MVMDGVLGVCAGQRWVIRGPQGSTFSGESKALRADIDDALGQCEVLVFAVHVDEM